MESKKMQIRMVKDGSRTIIVVDGPEKEADEAAFALIQQYYAVALQVPADSAPPLNNAAENPVVSTPFNEEPVVETVKDISAPPKEIIVPEAGPKAVDYSIARKRNNEIISDGKYAGMTTLEALQRYEERAFIDLIGYYKVSDNEAEKEEIKKTLRQFMIGLPNFTEEFLTRERRENFLRIIAEEYNPIGFINGYPNIKSFVTNASDEEIKETTKAFAQALCARAYKK